VRARGRGVTAIGMSLSASSAEVLYSRRHRNKVAMQMTGRPATRRGASSTAHHIVNTGDVACAAAFLDARLTAERTEIVSGHSLGTVAPISAAPPKQPLRT
jgi:hypothetical protein